MASAGTLWVDVRFNTDDLTRRLGAGLGAAGAGAGAALSTSLSSRLTSIGSSAANAGRQISLGLGLPLIAIGKVATDAFVGFDKAMTQITALVGINRAQTEAWRSDVLGVATTYGQSATEVAQALYFITSSGVAASDALNVLDISAKGAAVGLGSTNQVADAVTSAINAYGQENLSAAKAADILTVAVREGKGEADKMGGALSSIIPIGSALGVGFGELAGAMSAMTLSGTTADEAATQIRGILNTLSDMPPIAQRALKAQTGLDYATVRQNLSSKGLIPTLKEITDAFKGNEAATAEVFGNVRALTGVYNLFGEKEKQTADIVHQTTAAQGDLNKAFDETSQSAAFKLEQAKEKINAAMVEIGAAVVPVFTQVGEATAFVVRGFGGLPGPAKSGLVAIASLAAGAGPLLYVFGSAARLTGLLGQAVGKLKLAETFTFMTKSGSTLDAVIGRLGLNAQKFGGLIVAAAAAGVAGYSLLSAKMNENVEAFKALGESGKQKTGQAETWDEIQSRISVANKGIGEQKRIVEQLDEAAGTLFGKQLPLFDPGLAYDRKQAMDAGEAFMVMGQDAEKLAGQVAAVADKFRISRTAAAQWVQEQRKLHPEMDDSAKAVAAYTKAVKENDPSVRKVAETTAAASGTFAGLVAKVKDTSDTFFALTKAEDAYKAAQQAIVDARENVTKAQESYADAVRQTEAAQRRVIDADQRLIKSGKSLADARLAAADAQKTLNDALAGPSADEKINLDSAKLSVKEARAGMRVKPGEIVDPLARQRARIGLRQAQQSLKDAQGAHDEVIAGARKDLASAVESVADAEQAQRDAAQGVIDARLAVVDSQKKQADAYLAIGTAQDAVATAERNALDPAIALTNAQNNLNVMFETGTAEATKFRDYLVKLKELYPELGAVLDPIIEKFRILENLVRPDAEKIIAEYRAANPNVMGPISEENARAWKQGQDDLAEFYRKNPGVMGPVSPGQASAWLAAHRAHGGPLASNQLSTVNELGVPEMWSQGGKQWLLPLTAGKVSPMTPSDIPVKGGDGFNVGDINVYETSGKPRQTAYEIRRELRKESFLSGRRP